MSMYNMIHGMNPLAGPLISILKLIPSDVGRFRDCYLQKLNDAVVICVFTRNGGGNRSDYEEVTKRLREHPHYLEDRDEAHDSTYASYFFSIPPAHKEVIEEVIEASEGAAITKPAKERFEEFMEKLKAGDTEDPEVQRAKELGEKIFEAVNDNEGGIKVIKI